ncbi:MAG: pseudouridine synthase [Maribacter sp.]
MRAHAHFKIYKPFGMLSQFTSGEERQLRKKRFLSELSDFPQGTMPIGRLDEKSEGLLLLTTNGKLSDHINGSGVEKEYWAQLDGKISLHAIGVLEKGVVIGIHGQEYHTKPCKVLLLKNTPPVISPDKKLRIGRHRENSWISITITEGKFRQIRKMTAVVCYPTIRLIRVRIGHVHLDHLDIGNVESVNLNLFKL